MNADRSKYLPLCSRYCATGDTQTARGAEIATKRKNSYWTRARTWPTGGVTIELVSFSAAIASS